MAQVNAVHVLYVLNTGWRRVGVGAGQAEHVVDIRRQQTVAAVHVLAGVQVFMKPIYDRRHDLKWRLPEVHCTKRKQSAL